MAFEHSDALFPSAELRAFLAAEFEKQCRILCFGPIPTWNDVQARFESLRRLLQRSDLIFPLQSVQLTAPELNDRAEAVRRRNQPPHKISPLPCRRPGALIAVPWTSG
jgi:hypothetical protein